MRMFGLSISDGRIYFIRSYCVLRSVRGIPAAPRLPQYGFDFVGVLSSHTAVVGNEKYAPNQRKS